MEHRSVGTRNLYALAPDGLVDVQQWVVGLWDTPLSAFTGYVETHVQAEPDNPEEAAR